MANEIRTAEDLAQQAIIMHLHSKCWQGAKILDDEVMKRVGESPWLRGRKFLIDPALLNPIRAAQSAARKKLLTLSLPFPIDALHLIPKGVLELAERAMADASATYWALVDGFLGQYAEARENAKGSLGEFFNDADYPYDIRSKFGFEWKYVQLSAPSEMSVLTPEMYAREKGKFEDMMEEAREMAIGALRQEFSQIVSHCVDKLTPDKDGVPRVFRDSMVGKFQEFFATFGARNIFQDRRLAALIEDAKNALVGVDPNDIRSDAKLRREIRETMERVKTQMDVAITDRPLRKIRIATQQPQDEEAQAA